MSTRLRMWLVLAQFRPPVTVMTAEEAGARPVSEEDAEALAALLLEAYRGTVDDAGETLDDARAEIGRVLAAAYGPLLGEASFVVPSAAGDGRLLAASLVVKAARPLLVYLVCAPDAQGRGLATGLLRRSVAALGKDGHVDLWLAVNEKNEKAIRLYQRLGFIFA